MTRRHRLSDDAVCQAEAEGEAIHLRRPRASGALCASSANGSKSFVVVARDPRGKQHWRTVGAPPMKIDDARDIGSKIIRSIREAPPDSFEGVVSNGSSDTSRNEACAPPPRLIGS